MNEKSKVHYQVVIDFFEFMGFMVFKTTGSISELFSVFAIDFFLFHIFAILRLFQNKKNLVNCDIELVVLNTISRMNLEIFVTTL